MRTLVWFRGKDLRVSDHPALDEALKSDQLVPLFVLDPFFFAPERARELPHRIQFLLDSLRALETRIAALGSRLVVVRGRSIDVVPKLAHELEVDRVVGMRWSEPDGIERDRRVAKALAPIPFDLFEGETLARPSEVLTGGGTAYAVFTPFARAFAKTVTIKSPLRAPRSLPPLPKDVKRRSEKIPSLEDLGITRNDRIVVGGEEAAQKRLTSFLRGPGPRYHIGRDEIGKPGTSRLSQDLKFGVLSARTVWTAAKKSLSGRAMHSFTNELVWREFAYDVLRHRPTVLEEPYRPEWKRFKWRKGREADRDWRAWALGTTGYPLVDASARQLLEEGFVHNRARMISASFLTKHLLVDFRLGEAHYMKWLTDGDWAANDLGWQWATGCGVDAAPWFRVFNPVLQGKRFDPDGAYVRRWLPALAGLSDRFIHRPWEAPESELSRAKVVLGKTYPTPIVDVSFGRKRFLAAAAATLEPSR